MLCHVTDRVHMAQDRDKWWALVNMGPIKSGKYLKKLGDY
jgi:hypothetical protein